MAAFLLWASVAVIAYVYAGYPLLMLFLAKLEPDPAIPRRRSWPGVSLIIAAYNEEEVIHAKLMNSLCLNYPNGRLEVIVASDGSTDRTDEIVRGFKESGVRLVRVNGRQGKTVAQNTAAREATGDILVFSDANAIYELDAIRELVKHFSREDVGCVEGRRVDFASSSSATARHELTYRDFESQIKVWESSVLSCTGATGPIYAVRRAQYVPLDQAMISDFMEPLLIMSRYGRRQIFEPAAISREAVLPVMKDEFRRKIRIMTRCLSSLWMAPEVINPLQTGWFALQVISHRLLRWLVPVFALMVLAANLFLLAQPLYRTTFVLQTLFFLAAALGGLLDRLRVGPGFIRLPYYFCTANLAALFAIGNFLLGKNIVVWGTQRTDATLKTGKIHCRPCETTR